MVRARAIRRGRRGFPATASEQVLLPRVEERETVALGLIAEVVGVTTEGVDGEEVPPQLLREEEGDDGEVLVVAAGVALTPAVGLARRGGALDRPPPKTLVGPGGHRRGSVPGRWNRLSVAQAAVAAQRPERPVVAVEVVLEHEVTGEARAREVWLDPLAVGCLRAHQVLDAAHGGGVVERLQGEQGEQRPGRLRGGAGALAPQGGVLVGGAALTPAAIRLLVVFEPAHGSPQTRVGRGRPPR